MMHMVRVEALYAKTCVDLLKTHRWELSGTMWRKCVEQKINCSGIANPDKPSAKARFNRSILVVLNGIRLDRFRRKLTRKTTPLPINAKNEVNAYRSKRQISRISTGLMIKVMKMFRGIWTSVFRFFFFCR